MSQDLLHAPEADWELVSSSDDGEGGGPDLEAEAAALATSFQLAEPQLGASPPDTDVEGALMTPLGKVAADAADEPAPGSPEGLQQLHLMAVPLPPPTPGATSATVWGFGAGASSTAIPAAAPTGHPVLLPSDAAEAAGSASSVAGDSAAVSRSGSGSSPAVTVRLRVVRSDEQEALEEAVVDLEKSPVACRAGRQDRELALARLRLSTTQAALAAESREVCKLRRIAIIACSICAFLGLKALMGCPGAAAHCFTAAAAASSTATCHAPTEAHSGGDLRDAGRAELAGDDLERLVAVKVEPLAATGL